MADSEMRIVLLGKTGSGKSSTGNTILGKQAFKVDSSSDTVTKVSGRGHREREETILTVIDTPGLIHKKTYNEVKVQIEKAIDLVYPGPHVFLLVIRIGVRFSEEEENTVEWFLETLGEEAHKHIIVLFTHGKELGERTTIEQHLQKHSVLKKIVANMAEYHVFENDNKDDKDQVPELLEKINKVMEKNEKQIYTKEMYNEVQRKKHDTTSMEFAAVTEVPVGAAVLGVAATAASATAASATAGAVAVGAAAAGAVAVGAAAARGGHLGIAAAAGAAALVMGATAWAWVKKDS